MPGKILKSPFYFSTSRRQTEPKATLTAKRIRGLEFEKLHNFDEIDPQFLFVRWMPITLIAMPDDECRWFCGASFESVTAQYHLSQCNPHTGNQRNADDWWPMRRWSAAGLARPVRMKSFWCSWFDSLRVKFVEIRWNSMTRTVRHRRPWRLAGSKIEQVRSHSSQRPDSQNRLMPPSSDHELS